MKMSRRDLKILVKECLVEILAEGLTETTRTISESRQQNTSHLQGSIATTGRQSQENPRRTLAEKISFLPNKSEMRNPPATMQQNATRALASTLTSDPVMADIFADTARSGAHRSMNEVAAGRINHEQMIESAGDQAAKVMLRSDPTDVFSDSASKWAALAFAEKIPTRS